MSSFLTASAHKKPLSLATYPASEHEDGDELSDDEGPN